MKVSNQRSRSLLGQLSDMDLRLLRVFRAVVDCGGLSAAELELNIGTSTISRYVKDLETRLGLVLCRRGRGGFAVTPEGQRIYDETLKLLGSVQAFRSSVDALHDRLSGTLEVALFDKTATNPASCIAQAVAMFNDAAPDVALNVHVAPIPAIERGIMDGSFHLGVVPQHRSSRSLAYLDLFGETMFLYCGEGHPLFGSAPKDLTWVKLRKDAFAGLGYHSPNMELSHRTQLSRKATGYDQEAIATLVLSGRFSGSCRTTMQPPSRPRGACAPLHLRSSATTAGLSRCGGGRHSLRVRRSCCPSAWTPRMGWAGWCECSARCVLTQRFAHAFCARDRFDSVPPFRRQGPSDNGAACRGLQIITGRQRPSNAPPNVSPAPVASTGVQRCGRRRKRLSPSATKAPSCS